MMKFTLYIPSKELYNRWKRAAESKHMSLALFIRLAVNEKIQKMEDE